MDKGSTRLLNTQSHQLLESRQLAPWFRIRNLKCIIVAFNKIFKEYEPPITHSQPCQSWLRLVLALNGGGFLTRADISFVEFGFDICSLVSLSNVMHWLNLANNHQPLSRAAPNFYTSFKQGLRDWPSIKMWPSYEEIFDSQASDWREYEDLGLKSLRKIVIAIKQLFLLIDRFFVNTSEALLNKCKESLECVRSNLNVSNLFQSGIRALSLDTADPMDLRNSGWRSLLSDLLCIVGLVENQLKARKSEMLQLDLVLQSFPRNKDAGIVKVLQKHFEDSETIVNLKFCNFKLDSKLGVWQNIDMLSIETIRIRLLFLQNINELFLKCASYIDFSCLAPNSLGTFCKNARDVLKPQVVNEL